MKIAFATKDLTHINGHFGSAPYLAVYEIDTTGYQFLAGLEFPEEKEDGNEDKLTRKLEAMMDCTIVYVVAIGPSAAARLINKRVTPIKTQSEEDKITDVLDHLLETLKGNPPPWLRKALKQSTTSLETLEEEAFV